MNAADSPEVKTSSGEEEEEIFQSEAETTCGSEVEAELEPEKEKPAASKEVEEPGQEEEDKEDCSMEAIAERWRDKRTSTTGTTASNLKSEERPVASVVAAPIGGETVHLLAEMAEIEQLWPTSTTTQLLLCCW